MTECGKGGRTDVHWISPHISSNFSIISVFPMVFGVSHLFNVSLVTLFSIKTFGGICKEYVSKYFFLTSTGSLSTLTQLFVWFCYCKLAGKINNSKMSGLVKSLNLTCSNQTDVSGLVKKNNRKDITMHVIKCSSKELCDNRKVLLSLIGPNQFSTFSGTIIFFH